MDGLEFTKGLTQIEYERLLSRLAETIHTQRRLITIESAERVNAVTTRFTVKRQGEYYPYLIEEIFSTSGRNIYLHLGLLI